jgi:uncharacterized protein GlcG (DUF336 family)
MKNDKGSRRWRGLGFAVGLVALGMVPFGWLGCKGRGSDDEIFLRQIVRILRDDEDRVRTFNAENPDAIDMFDLTASDVEEIIQRAAEAIDDPMLTIVVVDRAGTNLGAWRRNPGTLANDLDRLNKAAAIARAGAFLSSSQGPLTSRTLEYISTFHFPPTFAGPQLFGTPTGLCFDTLPEQRRTTGIGNTSQGPLWQIFSTNRGARYVGTATLADGTATLTEYNAGTDGDIRRAPRGTNIDGTVPHTGLGYLPGGIPLYEICIPGDGIDDVCEFLCRLGRLPSSRCNRPPGSPARSGRVIGAVGCYIPNPSAAQVSAMEFAAFAGAGLFAFQGSGLLEVGPIPPGGRIFLVGILLPYVDQVTRPTGFGPGVFDPAGFVADINPVMAGDQRSIDGQPDPIGWLIGPRGDPRTDLGPDEKLSRADVIRVVTQGIEAANRTRAAIRLPAGTPTKMVLAVSNLDGLILGTYRMSDAPIFSIDVSITKARNVVYFSSPTVDRTFDFPLAVGDVPLGTAITNRTLGFLAQPFFPPTIDTRGTSPPIDFECAAINDPNRFERDDRGRRRGPLFPLVVRNQDPALFEAQGLNGPGIRLANPTDTVPAPPPPGAPPGPAALQSGLVMFPGASALYKNGVLVGGYGISGDGVEEDDFVTVGGIDGFEAPVNIRADNFSIDGVRLPYFKFPQVPGPGRNRSGS